VSWETVFNMMDWIKKVKPDRCTLSTFAPYPNCDIYCNPEKYNYEFLPGAKTNWKRYWILGYENTDEPFIGETEFMSNEDLVKAREILYNFMIRNGYKSPPPENFKIRGEKC